MGAIVYLAFSAARGAIGFALDDAWIHQVYARNLALRGEFAFFPGQPSAGSTSPLWTVLLSAGYLIQMDFRVWAYLLGAVLLGASAFTAARLISLLFPHFPLSDSHTPILVSLFLLLEWHLAWSAVSGMEILLFVFLSLLLLERFYAHEHAWVLGLIAGLLTLTRPEGIVLAALVGLGIIWDAEKHGFVIARSGLCDEAISNSALGIASRRPLAMTNPRSSAFIRVLFYYGIGFAILLTPYLIFNFAMSGTILPNTFYAKNVEYAELLERTPFLLRWLQLFFVPWVGAQILLLPGFVFIVIALVVRRQWLALIPFAWTMLLPALYALRLPVAYQHGRYEMPIVPFIVLYGVWGTLVLFERIRNRIVRMTWGLSITALLIAFWYLGATQYATDVAIIDCEMVQSARWVAANAPADAVVAAHDIGALGYFYERPVIDLAGLVSPEVIPFMRDEGRLRDFLLSRRATLVIFFPDWYSTLASDPRFVPVHQRNCPAAREAGGTDIRVYKILLTPPQ